MGWARVPRIVRWGLVAVLWVVGCASQPITVTPRPVTLRVLAADAYGPLAEEVAFAYHEARPWVRVEVETFDRGVVEERLRAGAASVGIVGGSPPAQFWAAPIATDGLAVIVHPAVPVEGLTLAELREVFRGRIGEWPDGTPVQVVSREEGSGTRALFEERVMGGSDVTLTALVAVDSRSMLEAVSATPGAIGYVACGRLEGGVRPIAIDGVPPTTPIRPEYPLRYPVLLVAPAEPEGEARAFAQWLLEPEGQATVLSRLAPPDK